MVINYNPAVTPNWTLPIINIPKGSNNCGHTFPIWMVIPPQGCTVTCPVCGKPTFIQGTQITC